MRSESHTYFSNGSFDHSFPNVKASMATVRSIVVHILLTPCSTQSNPATRDDAHAVQYCFSYG